MMGEERLARMERELMETKAGLTAAKRRNHWMLAAMALAIVVLGLTCVLTKTTVINPAQTAGAGAKVVRANALILEDASGKERIKIGVADGEPVLFMTDANETTRLAMGVQEDMAQLYMFDASGKVRAGISEHPRLSVFGPNGDLRASLSVAGSEPGLALNDGDGNCRILVAMLEDEPGLVVFDTKKSIAWSAP